MKVIKFFVLLVAVLSLSSCGAWVDFYEPYYDPYFGYPRYYQHHHYYQPPPPPPRHRYYYYGPYVMQKGTLEKDVFDETSV